MDGAMMLWHSMIWDPKTLEELHQLTKEFSHIAPHLQASITYSCLLCAGPNTLLSTTSLAEQARYDNLQVAMVHLNEVHANDLLPTSGKLPLDGSEMTNVDEIETDKKVLCKRNQDRSQGRSLKMPEKDSVMVTRKGGAARSGVKDEVQESPKKRKVATEKQVVDCVRGPVTRSKGLTVRNVDAQVREPNKRIPRTRKHLNASEDAAIPRHTRLPSCVVADEDTLDADDIECPSSSLTVSPKPPLAGKMKLEQGTIATEIKEEDNIRPVSANSVVNAASPSGDNIIMQSEPVGLSKASDNVAKERQAGLKDGTSNRSKGSTCRRKDTGPGGHGLAGQGPVGHGGGTGKKNQRWKLRANTCCFCDRKFDSVADVLRHCESHAAEDPALAPVLAAFRSAYPPSQSAARDAASAGGRREQVNHTEVNGYDGKLSGHSGASVNDGGLLVPPDSDSVIGGRVGSTGKLEHVDTDTRTIYQTMRQLSSLSADMKTRSDPGAEVKDSPQTAAGTSCLGAASDGRPDDGGVTSSPSGGDVHIKDESGALDSPQGGATTTTKCVLCRKHFRSDIAYVTHLNVEHVWKRRKRRHDKKRPMLCALCGNVYQYEQNYHMHYKRHHLGIKVKRTRANQYKPRSYKCSLCPFVTSETRRLCDHVAFAHHGVKPYTCRSCDYKTWERTSLRDHEYRHLDKKKFQCGHCQYQCIQKKQLRSHMMKKHGLVLPKTWKQHRDEDGDAAGGGPTNAARVSTDAQTTLSPATKEAGSQTKHRPKKPKLADMHNAAQSRIVVSHSASSSSAARGSASASAGPAGQRSDAVVVRHTSAGGGRFVNPLSQTRGAVAVPRGSIPGLVPPASPTLARVLPTQAHDPPAQANPAQAHPAQPHPVFTLPTQAHPAQSHPAQFHPAQAHPAQVHPTQTHLTQAHVVLTTTVTSHPHPGRSLVIRPGPAYSAKHSGPGGTGNAVAYTAIPFRQRSSALAGGTSQQLGTRTNTEAYSSNRPPSSTALQQALPLYQQIYHSKMISTNQVSGPGQPINTRDPSQPMKAPELFVSHGDPVGLRHVVPLASKFIALDPAAVIPGTTVLYEVRHPQPGHVTANLGQVTLAPLQHTGVTASNAAMAQNRSIVTSLPFTQETSFTQNETRASLAGPKVQPAQLPYISTPRIGSVTSVIRGSAAQQSGFLVQQRPGALCSLTQTGGARPSAGPKVHTTTLSGLPSLLPAPTSQLVISLPVSLGAQGPTERVMLPVTSTPGGDHSLSQGAAPSRVLTTVAPLIGSNPNFAPVNMNSALSMTESGDCMHASLGNNSFTPNSAATSLPVVMTSQTDAWSVTPETDTSTLAAALEPVDIPDDVTEATSQYQEMTPVALPIISETNNC